MKLKQRVYAAFQFVTLVALTCFILVGAIIMTSPEQNQSSNIFTDGLTSVLTFKSNEAMMQFAGFLAYFAFTAILASWIGSLLILKIKDRNLFDSMFLMFFFIPGISNIFCFFAQMSLHTQTYTQSKLDKKEIEDEKTRIIELFEARAEKIKAHSEKNNSKNFSNNKKNDYNNIETTEENMSSKNLVDVPEVMQIIGESKHMPTTKKVAAKKVATKKVAAKPAAKKVAKPAAKKAAAKPAAKKATVKKAVAKKPVAKKATVKKATVKKTTAKKATAKKATKK